MTPPFPTAEYKRHVSDIYHLLDNIRDDVGGHAERVCVGLASRNGMTRNSTLPHTLAMAHVVSQLVNIRVSLSPRSAEDFRTELSGRHDRETEN